MTIGRIPPRHRAAGPQGFGRDPHPSGPIPVPAPRRPPDGGVVVRFHPIAPVGPPAGASRPPTAPLPVLARARRRLPLGLICALAMFLSAVASIMLVTLRTVPPSLPSPLPTPPPAAVAAPATSFGDGSVAVGRGIVPGTYVAPGGPGCRWARLSASGAVRASGSPRGTARITVRAADAAVRTTGCGTWTRSGP